MLCDRLHCPGAIHQFTGRDLSPVVSFRTVLHEVVPAYKSIHVACAFILTSDHVALQGLFDAAYFNAVFGNVYDQRDELLRTALLLKPG